MSYFEAPSSYLERVAALKGKRKNWEKNLLDKVSQELRAEGYYDPKRKIEQPEINKIPLPKRRKLNVEEFQQMDPTAVALWVENINPTVMRGHRHKFLRASVTGKKLLQMGDFHLKDIGIGNRSQRKLIFKHIQRVKNWTEKQLKKRQKLKEKHEKREEEGLAKLQAERAAKDPKFRAALKAQENEKGEKAKMEHAKLLKYGRMRDSRKRSRSRSESPPSPRALRRASPSPRRRSSPSPRRRASPSPRRPSPSPRRDSPSPRRSPKRRRKYSPSSSSENDSDSASDFSC